MGAGAATATATASANASASAGKTSSASIARVVIFNSGNHIFLFSFYVLVLSGSLEAMFEM